MIHERTGPFIMRFDMVRLHCKDAIKCENCVLESFQSFKRYAAIMMQVGSLWVQRQTAVQTGERLIVTAKPDQRTSMIAIGISVPRIDRQGTPDKGSTFFGAACLHGGNPAQMQHIKIARLPFQQCLKGRIGGDELLRLQQGKCFGELLLRGAGSFSHLWGRTEI
ncbi:MAG: hypothetical protein O9273_15925 [Acetobacteraceae bacterium]|nr:hypothetical protein [Acetobacteraceae bacterium]